MPVSLHFAPIIVSDADAALAFYRDGLGLPVANDVAANGGRWITLGTPDGAQIVLTDPAGGRSPADAEALERLVVKGAMGPYVFATDDLAATFDRAVAAGAEVLEEPKDHPWGPRDCAFRDPSGNLVRVQQAVPVTR